MPKGIYIRTEYHRKIISECRKGVYPSLETKEKMSCAKKGKIPKNIHLLNSPEVIAKRNLTNIGHVVTEATRNKIALSRIGEKNWSKLPEVRKKMRESRLGRFLGEKCGAWKGGVTSINKQIRGSDMYIQWRKLVFERDNYTCQWCKKRGGKIEADHIKPFAWFLDFRFDITNGKTLCTDCHKWKTKIDKRIYVGKTLIFI